MGESGLWTTGQLAKQTGLTIRTLRYYDQIGLLHPEQHSAGSARLYTIEDLKRLQRIQTLKFIGLSLREIKEALDADSSHEGEIKSSLKAQLQVLQQKIAHSEQVVSSIHKAMEISNEATMPTSEGSRLLDIIQAICSEQNWGEQYRNAARLQSRIHLYDKFSKNPLGWHRWVFDQMEAGPYAHVLELGCGDGTLWHRNADRIPAGWRITLTDLSRGMVEEARHNLRGQPCFKFMAADAQEIPFHGEQFDIVVANHMMYHVADLPKAINEMHRVLKKGGLLCISTMSLQHLQEIETLAQSYDPALQVLDPAIQRFHLDNGRDMLSSSFSDLKLLRYEDRLVVDEANALIDYMISTPMNARIKLQGKSLHDFREHINHTLQQVGFIELTKDNGIFLGRK